MSAHKELVFFLLLFTLFILLSSPTIASYCYQESANVATVCGGLSTGAYTLTGRNWVSGEGEPYDGNWSSSDRSTNTSYEYIYVNYTIPSAVNKASLWQVKDCGTTSMVNLSIPTLCRKTSPIQFRIGSKYNGFQSDYNVVWACYNTTAWETLRSNGGTLCALVEEGVWWNASNWAPALSSVIINASDSPDNTTRANLTAFVSSFDADGDNISYAWDWREDNVSIAVLNMNFDVEGGAGSGKTKDYSIFSNNGTLGNGTTGTEPTWNATGGWNGTGAYEFDGSNDFIQINDSEELSFTTGVNDSPFSISVWIKVKQAKNNEGIVSKSNYYNRGEYYLLEEGDYLFFRVVDNSTKGYIGRYVNNSLFTNVWQHIVATYNGSKTSDGMKIYIDGSEVSTLSSNSGTYSGMEDTSQPLFIGRRDNYFNGSIDDVMIFNRSLSATQVLALYNNRSDLIVSDETSVGENWSVCVTPNDGATDGSEVCSNTAEVLDTCTYHNSGDWLVYGSDQCSISSSVDLLGNALRCTGAGSLIVTGSIFNWSDVAVDSACELRAEGGGSLN